jgi:SOS-response transcriptional repressor LexA
MTQDQLGQALGGLTGPTISAIESGTAKSFRDPDLILKAAKVLGISPIWLQFGMGDVELIRETVPLIDWADVLKTPIRPAKVKRCIGTTVAVSPKSYALKVDGNSMVAQSGNEVSFREGMIVIVDPEVAPKPNSFVITSHNKVPMLRKLVQEGTQQYLQPLNQLFQQELVNSKTKFHGVVKAILQEELN